MSQLYDPAARVRFGTSSFSSKDWVGPFYPERTPAGQYLSFYAQQLDTVEVDATYYAIPSARLVDGWNDKTPPGFLLSAKFPKSIVHGGAGPRPDPRHVITDGTYADRDEFLEVMSRLGDKLGPLLIQFPYFNRALFPSGGAFLERLDGFLGDLPREGFRFAVEVRNKAWVTPDFRDVLAKHGVSMALVDQAWMPHGDALARRMDVVTADPVYVRLIGDRKEIEAITKTWEREVLDREASMQRWAALIARFTAAGSNVVVYVNNHFCGHAPATLRRLRAMYDELTSTTS